MKEGEGVLDIMHGRSRMTIHLASLQCRDGARRVSTDQADIACNICFAIASLVFDLFWRGIIVGSSDNVGEPPLASDGERV